MTKEIDPELLKKQLDLLNLEYLKSVNEPG